jgi:hypothetical protein
MSSTELKAAFVTPDGKIFDNKAEAQDYLRRPKIKEAMLKVTGNQDDLAEWLIEHQELVETVFDVGTIRRVTKSERKQLEKALEAVKEAGDKKFAFLIENSSAVSESFRWPTVKRMDDKEKEVAILTSLVAATENQEVAEWIINSKAPILEAYQAGKVKREVNAKAAEALKAYREKRAADKAAAEATA